MSSKSKNKSSGAKPKMSYEQRKRRSQQILFTVLVVIIILSFVISLVIYL